MIINTCKKALDKVTKRGYNIHTDRAVDIDTFIAEYVDNYSCYKEHSIRQIDNLVSLGEKIEKKWSNHFPTKPLPCIAGGAVRDIVFGLRHNDIDVFFDATDIGKDWQESTGFEDGPEILINTFINDIIPSDEEVLQLGEKYDENPNSLFVFEQYDVDNEECIQFIGKNNLKVSVDCIDEFDYDLVKIAYDISTKKFIVSDDFNQGLNKEYVIPRMSTMTGYSREQKFLNNLRNFYLNSSANAGLKLYSPKKEVNIQLEAKLVTSSEVKLNIWQSATFEKYMNYETQIQNLWNAVPVRDVQQQ